MKRLIDLHLHTNYSDGSHGPAAVVAMAKKRGLAAIAVADHDTIAAVKEVQAEGARLGIEVVTAVEISSSHLGRGLHILGYFIEVDDHELNELLREQAHLRIARAEQIVQKLNDIGFALDFQELLKAAKGSISRPQIAEAVLASPKNRLKLGPDGDGYTQNRFFDEYLKRGGRAYVKKSSIDSCAAVEAIARANGLSLVAHPGTNLAFGEFGILDSLVDCGLDGVEAYCSSHSPEEMEIFADYASRKGLCISGGSDFHGSMYSEIEMGSGIDGNLSLGYEMLEELRAHHRAKSEARLKRVK